MLLKEKEEAVKLAAEQASVVHEIPVVDHELMDKLSAENDKLKVCYGLMGFISKTFTFYCLFHCIKFCVNIGLG